MSNTPVTPNMTSDQTQPTAGPPTGSAITGQPQGPQGPPAGQPPTGQPTAQPTPNAAQPIPTTAAGQPNQPNAAQSQPAPDPNAAHVSLYSQILRGLTPRVPYVDASGNVQQQPVSIGKTVVAAAIAGMLSKPNYRMGSYGPIRDTQADASDAFQAGQNVITKQQQDAQALSDKQRAIKLSNIKNSIDQVHLMKALAEQRHQELQGVLDSNQPALDDFKATDDKQADPSKKIILADKMTFQQALDSPLYGKGKMTTNSILMSGRQSVYDPETGETHEVPLFTILSPEAGGVTISEDQKKNFSTINRSFDGMGGLDARIPIHQYLALQGNLTSVQHFQSFIKRADEQLGIKENADLAAAVKKDPTLINGIRAAEGALAQGGSLADTLQRIQHGTNGTVNWDSSKLFEAMGLDQDKVAAYIRADQLKRGREDALAKEGGIGDKAPAPQQMTNDIIASAKNLPKDQRDAIMAGVNPNGLTVGEAEKLKDKILQSVQQNRTDAANNPKLGTAAPPVNFVSNPNASTMDSVDLQKDLTTKGVKLPVQFESLYTVAHNAAGLKDVFPTSPRKGTTGLSAQEALAFIHQYINPTYQEGDYPAAAGLSKELASTRQGTAGGSLLSAGVASNHLELLDQAATALANNDTLALNHLANAFGVQLGKSPAVTFKAIADQVNQEVGKVVAGGTPHEAELENLRANLNTDQSPEQTRNVIKSYVKLMSGRVNEINERSQQYFQRDVKGISPETARVFAKYGVEVPGYAIVTIPGVAKATLVPKSQLAAIKAKYPNATTGGQ
jgi:hypothetical protein